MSSRRQHPEHGATPQLHWLILLPVLALAAWLLASMVNRVVAEESRTLPELDEIGPAAPSDLLLDGAAQAEAADLRGWPPPSPLSPAGPTTPNGQKETETPITRLPLVLVGTVVSSDARWSQAFISAEGEGKAGSYRTGDLLPGRAEITAIRSDRVELSLDGRARVLYLSHENSLAPRTATPRPQPVASSAIVQSLGGGRFRIDRDGLNRVLARPGSLTSEARVTMAFGDDGAISGLRLLSLNDGSLVSQIGLGKNDVIRRVNQYSLDDPERMLEIYQQLKSAGQIELEVESAGRTRRLSYRIE